MVMELKLDQFKLPEGVPPELTVSELEEMACRQQQQIESQRQLLAAKEQRLRFLKQHEAKHQQVAAEHERLRRLRDRVEAQEQKLRKLRALRGQVDQTKLNNASLTSDLESIRALFNEKEKELSVAVAKVEELTLQLEELQRGRNSNSGQMPPSSAAVELEKLRAELMYRNKLNEQQSARLSHQREVLAQRQEEMSAIDRRIAELQSRLHRKRLLNQQLASHINKHGQQPNQNAVQPNHQQQPQFQPIFQRPVSQHQKQQQQQQQQMKHHQQMMQAQKQQNQKLQQSQIPHSMYYQVNASTKNGGVPTAKNGYPSMATTAVPKTSVSASTGAPSGRTVPSTNIAAVEPYHHVPSASTNHHGYQPALDVKRSHRKSDPLQQHVQPDQSHQRRVSHYPSHNQKDVAKVSPSSNNDDQRILQQQDDERRPSTGDTLNDASKSDDRLPEFWPNKFDSKYQTLPSGTKFAVTSNSNANNAKYILRRPGEGVENSSPQQTAHENVNQKSNERKYSSEDNFNNNVKDNVAETNDKNNNNGIADSGRTTTNANTIVGNQPTMQQQNAIVRSIPIASNGNKGLATTPPSSNINYVSRSTTCSTAATAVSSSLASRSFETSPYNSTSSGNQSTKNAQNTDNNNSSMGSTATTSSTAVTFTSTYQKPVSSVSPIYQTSSTRIQPVQPQVIGSLSSGPGQEHRRNYSQNATTQSSSVAENAIAKPALPPKPAQPVKATPPPPPRQSAFHTQYTTLPETKSNEGRTYFGDFGGRGNANENASDSHSSGSDKEQSSSTERRLFSNGGSVDLSNELNALSIISRNDATKQQSESPPPLPSVEPPSDDEVDRSMKLKTIYVQNSLGNHHRAKDINRVHQITSISDRLMSDLSQDSSSSDTSSAENNYFVGTNRRIELPPAYLFPENETPPRDLVCSNSEKDIESSDDTSADHRNIILNTNSSSDQSNVDNVSDNDKFSLISSSPDSENTEKMNTLNKELQFSDDIKKIKKGNLKNNNSVNSKRRVSFDPLALLLDASLEGELELVKRTASQVKNPSAANDEGITALHNAICAGHFEIVQFLVEFGCDVNAQDSDGWTPLHCAASCNNLPMVRFLVEHGACIFATTLSDQETAAEKCEEDEEGYDGCSQFLYSVQEKLGILNSGIVYAVFDYEAHNPDELNFKEGDRLTVLRKGDEWEREWWWSRLNDKEGYIPRNLLGLYPRTHPNANKKIQE